MNEEKIISFLDNLLFNSKENEYIEFKENYHSSEEIGETISALSNTVCLLNKKNGYLIFGIDDKMEVIGTTFSPKTFKKGNEEFENWICKRLVPKIDFRVYETNYKEKPIVLFQIPATENQPVKFNYEAYIRINSITRKLREFPEKERKIWGKNQLRSFEKEISISKISPSEVINLLDTQSFFELLNLPYPSERDGVIEKLVKMNCLIPNDTLYDITNLGGLLFAKNISDFENLSSKAVRVIVYKDNNRITTIREQMGTKGYAVGFEGLINWINSQLPENEIIGKVFRDSVRMYPEISIRELVANTLIHQEFLEKGTGPMIEIFSDRIEFTNPGLPIITPTRFIDEYQSRNESLAKFMRLVKICEEKGSGIDKVIFQVELFQLPAPDIQVQEKHTKVILYSYKKLNNMDKKDKIRACYQHACLKYVQNVKMTNQSLRQRFKIDEKNSAIASRIIRDTIKDGFIKDDDPENTSKRYSKYIPFWA